jgi:hypothetical protein
MRFERTCAAFVVFWTVWTNQIHADEPMMSTPQKFANGDFEWRLDDDAGLILSIFDAQSGRPAGRYDLTGCLFCSGEDDNCDSDGILEVDILSMPREPVLAVTCHVGAHSQQLQILAPWRNREQAVHSVTGAYYLVPTPTPNGIGFEYDKSNQDGTFRTVVGNWP